MSGYFNMLLGGGVPTFFIYTTAITDNHIGSAQSAIEYQTDADIVATTITGGAGDAGDWIAPRAAAPGGYTIRAHADSGTMSTGTMDTDIALSTTPSWTVSQTGTGSKACTATFTIKNAAGATMKTGQITLTAIVP